MAACGREQAPLWLRNVVASGPKQTVAVSGGKIPYVFREVVTKLMKHKSATAETDCYTKYEIH